MLLSIKETARPVWILLGIPLSLEIRVLLSSEDRVGTSHLRALDLPTSVVFSNSFSL